MQKIIDWSPFTKKSKFSYQNEFRITFLSQNTDSIKVDLDCSLRDIAVPICTEDLNKIHFKNGNLLYPKYSKIRLRLIRFFQKSRVYLHQNESTNQPLCADEALSFAQNNGETYGK